MALNPSTNPTMSGRITAPDAEYPYGSSKDETLPGVGDGMPYFKARADDILGMQQALLNLASIVPSGDADNVLASDYMKAFVELVSGRAFNYDDSGAVDAYVLGVRAKQYPIAGYFEGLQVLFFPVNTNTGASTANISGLGIVNIKLKGGVSDPVAGDLVAGDESKLIYRTSPVDHLELINPVTTSDVTGQLSVNAMIHVQDQKPTGVGGGNNVAGFQKRTLNTVLVNTIPGATLSANEITLPAGVYYLEASSQCYDVQRAQATIRNVTDATDLLIGISTYSPTAAPPSIPCHVSGEFTLTATKNIDINQYLQSVTINGLGLDCSSGKIEVYSEIKVWKV